MEYISTIAILYTGYYLGDKLINTYKYTIYSIIGISDINNIDNIVEDKNNCKNLVKINNSDNNSNLIFNDNDLNYLPDEIKQNLECGISGSYFRDPVITPQGYTIEKSTIINWLNNSKKCPYTKAKLTKDELVSNKNIKNAINFFIQLRNISKISNNDIN